MAWYIEKGPEGDVILSSRVRLARNLNGYVFPNKMTEELSSAAAEDILNALKKRAEKSGEKFHKIQMSGLGNEDKKALVERHLISDELTESSLARFAFVKDDESVSVMINEEDHMRIQAMESGLNLESAYKAASDVAIALEKSLPIAFHETYGFVTSCPTNTGTGMRASVLMHLPVLSMTGAIGVAVEKIRKMGYSVRGYYGEHSTASGNMYQISNQITLGLEEEEIIADLKKLIFQIAEQERTLREEIYKKNPAVIEDKVYRALGILKYARILSSEEALKLISDVRLGKALGIIDQPDEANFNRIMTVIGPASVQKSVGKILDTRERDIARAMVIKKELKGEK